MCLTVRLHEVVPKLHWVERFKILIHIAPILVVNICSIRIRGFRYSLTHFACNINRERCGIFLKASDAAPDWIS
jgi:hypothetical protein